MAFVKAEEPRAILPFNTGRGPVSGVETEKRAQQPTPALTLPLCFLKPALTKPV